MAATCLMNSALQSTLETERFGPHVFDTSEVKPWQSARFDTVEKLQDAPRNAGSTLETERFGLHVFDPSEVKPWQLACFDTVEKLQDAPRNAGSTLETERFGPHVFDPSEVKPWQPARFDTVEKLQDAPRNAGEVLLMWDKLEYQYVAVKRMPNAWFQSSHAEFVETHPHEIECPWQDIGCNKFLNSIGFQYSCVLLGVYRDHQNTFVVTAYANKGDLFSWCDNLLNQRLQPGPDREAFVRPLIMHLLLAVQQLHELSIVHRDISMENILLSETADGRMLLQLIDFGMASYVRHFQGGVTGKPSYQAPELHSDGVYDAFLSDAFAVGVTIYQICLQSVPWLSTKPHGCKCFKFVQKHGFLTYVRKRKMHHTEKTVADCASEELLQLLGGLLELDPAKRLTLGEATWCGQRRSAWDETWLCGSKAAKQLQPQIRLEAQQA